MKFIILNQDMPNLVDIKDIDTKDWKKKILVNLTPGRIYEKYLKIDGMESYELDLIINANAPTIHMVEQSKATIDQLYIYNNKSFGIFKSKLTTDLVNKKQAFDCIPVKMMIGDKYLPMSKAFGTYLANHIEIGFDLRKKMIDSKFKFNEFKTI